MKNILELWRQMVRDKIREYRDERIFLEHILETEPDGTLYYARVELAAAVTGLKIEILECLH